MMNEKNYFGHGAYDYFMHKKEMALREEGFTEREIGEVLGNYAPRPKDSKRSGFWKKLVLGASHALSVVDASEYAPEVVRPTKEEREWALLDRAFGIDNIEM